MEHPIPPLRHRLAVGVGAAALVVADVFTLGFVTLGFQMVTSRILTPLFGSGIYTWATIISISIGGLMLGYFLGGMLADRFPGFGFAATIKFIASAYLFFIYFLSQGGLEIVASGVDNEYVALFLSGFVVCFPPLLVLGMYSPLSVRLLLKLPSDAGKISGGLFAISSLGNILGIFIVTFFLIPNLGTRTITAGFATFLLATGFFSLVTRALYRGNG